MTSYVTREEYDWLAARLEALEMVKPDSPSITVTVDSAGSEAIRDLVRKGISDAWANHVRSIDRGGFGLAQRRYASQKG